MDGQFTYVVAWEITLGALTVALAVVASGHAVIYKRESRAALLWAAFVWMVPLAGALIYFLFGINRIKRRAVSLRGRRTRQPGGSAAEGALAADVEAALGPADSQPASLARALSGILSRPLLSGNRVAPLVDGDAAFPAMLDAIEQAQRSISLSTYIFDRDEAGLRFAAALGAAARRGVEVRVLIDATGTRYSWPSILGALQREGVRYARFLPAFPLWRMVSMNLRNHRKLLVADGRIAFTGGMNLRIGHCLSKQPAHPVQDIQFRVEGPVVAQLQGIFADDWAFTTGEELRGERWFPRLDEAGPVIARGIADGPDADFEKARWCILCALATARRSVRIATPYFLPDPGIVTALNLAALRGVKVDIVLPSSSNLPVVQWASTAHWWQVLGHGCRLWLSPPPFDHSKLLVVDDAWSFVGSANWDPRSLRLNFELNLEGYDAGLARELTALFEAKRRRSRRVTLADVDARRLPVRLRDGIARLFTPFL